MAEPRTLTQIAGAPLTPSPLANAALLVIDLQNEYLKGALKLDQIERAVTETQKLLALARANGVPVFHFQHKTGPGAPIFDPVLIVTMTLVMIVVMIESTGMFLALSDITGKPIVALEATRRLNSQSPAAGRDSSRRMTP